MNTYKELRKIINKPITDILQKFSPTEISEESISIDFRESFKNSMCIECSIVKKKDFFMLTSDNITDIKIHLYSDIMNSGLSDGTYKYHYYHMNRDWGNTVRMEINKHHFNLIKKLTFDSKTGFQKTDYVIDKYFVEYYFKINTSVVDINWTDLMVKNLFIDHLESTGSKLKIDENNLNLISKYFQPLLNNDKFMRKPIFSNILTDFINNYPFGDEIKEEELSEYMELTYAK
tara:strand:- start:3454 stop:4149 length:696 start_codon:yes stop_codon:yes gene_type:complete